MDGYLLNSILITGATGTFGNSFIRRLLRSSDYSRIVVFSRDELKSILVKVIYSNDLWRRVKRGALDF